jgi:hypothetical protein
MAFATYDITLTLIMEFHKKFFCHFIRVVWLLCNLLFIVEVDMQYHRPNVVLPLVESVRQHFKVLVEGQYGPFTLNH